MAALGCALSALGNAGVVPTGVPQRWQNLAPSLSAEPHPAQRAPAIGAPQLAQKCPEAGEPQLGQDVELVGADMLPS